jgi:prepilin-type N-terminal cleavage/methylation domain-containing protein
MKKSKQQYDFEGVSGLTGKRASGFSLMELMVAMAMFLIVGGAAVNLFKKHVPLFTQQQNQTTVNVAMRNAAAQMQIDLANAGTGYYQGVNIPAWPIGLTIQNPANGAVCNVAGTQTYGAGCFDTLNIISVDPNTPPANAADIGSNCVSTTSSTLFAVPVGATTAAQLAADYQAGDELLLVKSDGSQMTTVVLSQSGQVSGNKVQLQHNPTAADGSNAGDPYGIANPADSNKLGTQFCTTDWILKIDAITYSVDTVTNPANPTLVRTQGVGGPANVVADQIVGFRVGAWNTVTNQYEYNVANFNADWSSIKSVRLSLIGRTNPQTAANTGYRNTFDNGPYRVEGVSIVVNPRNMSMN